jgi:hypothetical protein
MVSSTVTLQNAIHQLENLNQQLTDELHSNSSKEKEISEKIAKNNSMILDYKFRISQK